MKPPSIDRLGAVCAAVWLACCPPAHAQVPGFQSSPYDLTVRVQDIHSPGGTVYDDHRDVVGAFAVPKQSAEILYLAPLGANFSRHSTNIGPAFASTLAESDGNGGVGVSSWIAGSAVPGTPSTDSLVAQATWNQSFTYLGSESVQLNFHFEIPKLTVGLIGVAPNRDAPSKTERAYAVASMTSFVLHGDGSTTNTGRFEFGISVDEYQVPLGPGFYENYADATFTLDGLGGLAPTVHYPSDPYNPEWSIDPVHGDVPLATMTYGDSLVYTYTLTATGHTLGSEHGYYAFLGDPSGVDVIGGSFGVVTAPVPEPQAWALMALGLAGIGWRRRVRR